MADSEAEYNKFFRRERRANSQWSTVISKSKDNLELWSEDDDLEQSLIRLSMRENLAERCNKWACICQDDAGWPLSYGFCESPAEDQTISEDFPVTFLSAYLWHPPTIFQEWLPFWLKLDGKAQDLLYTILATGVPIMERIYYDSEKDRWRPRDPSMHIPDDCTLLTSFGVMATMQISGSVLDHLARGRSREDLEKMNKSCVHFQRRKELVNSWSTAFVDGMTDGVGREAVSHLFKAVFAVLDDSGCSIPPLEILNISSSSQSDAFSISSSSSTSGASEAKQRKLDEQAQKKPNIAHWPPKESTTSSHPYVDLSVVTQDGVNGVAKFLVLVEIHSKGKTTEKAAVKKLMKELIYVLQCQSEVFGLLFSETKVQMYHAKKAESGGISIAHDTYNLLYFVSSDGVLHVAEFQRLIIDILTCLVFGVNSIIA